MQLIRHRPASDTWRKTLPLCSDAPPPRALARPSVCGTPCTTGQWPGTPVQRQGLQHVELLVAVLNIGQRHDAYTGTAGGKLHLIVARGKGGLEVRNQCTQPAPMAASASPTGSAKRLGCPPPTSKGSAMDASNSAIPPLNVACPRYKIFLTEHAVTR